MDARLKTATYARDADAYPFAPAPAPLDMPVQALDAAVGAPLTQSAPLWRLGFVAVFAAALSCIAVALTASMLRGNGLALLDMLMLVLVGLNMFWVASAAVTAAIGAISLALEDRRPVLLRPTTKGRRTALLYPVYNEDFPRVLTNAWRGHTALGAEAGAFDVFFISDSNKPECIAEEECAIATFRATHPSAPVYYRRRAQNHGRKAGNVADFVRTWGDRYDYMIVYDADSTMTGEAVQQLVNRMDERANTAIIQTVPAINGARTMFAHIQQFALNMYGPLFGRGLAWWSGGGGNYWGHNAIVRVSAFAAHAGLPRLKGAAPFGGEILSHDFVEAALLRRAGWDIELAPDITGSFEQAPPTMIETAARDRRWAQGNLQHLSVWTAPGLDWRSRAHIGAGIMGYGSSLLWLALFGLCLITQPNAAAAIDPEVARATFWLGTLTALIVLAPKWLALALWLAGKLPRADRSWRFIAALVLEGVAASLITPILIVNQAIAVADILRGRDSGWSAQIRQRDCDDIAPHAAAFAPHAMIACVGLAASWIFAPAAFAPVAFVAISLLAAPFISHFLAHDIEHLRGLTPTLRTPLETSKRASSI